MGDVCLTDGRVLLRANRLPGRQGRLALAYLLTAKDRPVPRGTLADILWPQRLPRASEVALSAVVSKLRGLFAEVGLGRNTLRAASGCYLLHLPHGSWLDVECAVESVHQAESDLREGNWKRAYGPAVVAYVILRQPFMPGDDGPWIDSQREALRRVRLRALDCLAEIHARNGEHSLALAAAEEAVELEPFRESGYRRLMQLHEDAGNPAEALRVYAHLHRLLEAELGTSPDAQTRALIERRAQRQLGGQG